MKSFILTAMVSAVILSGVALANQFGGEKQRSAMQGMMGNMMSGEKSGMGGMMGQMMGGREMMGGMKGMMGMMNMMGQMGRMVDQCQAMMGFEEAKAEKKGAEKE